MSVPLPHRVARFNKRVTNRFIEPFVRRSARFAVVRHRGRHTGRAYSTPIILFPLGDDAIVVLTYGPSADWVRNVLTGGGTVEDASGRRAIDAVQIVDRTVAWPALPSLVQRALLVLPVQDFARLSFHDCDPLGPLLTAGHETLG